jgi:glycosyltransferase involved in cell wall biosynthesis
LKVLIQTRPDVRVGAGGDWVQAQKTAEHLRLLGVDVTLSTARVPDVRGFDLVHLITLYTYEQARRAVRHGCPLVVSPVYWNCHEYAQRGVDDSRGWKILKQTLGRLGSARRLKCLAAALRHSDNAYPKFPEALAAAWQQSKYSSQSDKLFQWVIAHAAILLPNSKIEGESLKRDFHVTAPVVAVHNGVEAKYASPPSGIGPEPLRRPYLLNVAARFNPRKNQLSVVRALRDTNHPVVFTGRTTNPLERRYLHECMAHSTPRMTFIRRPLGEEELIPLYQRARVHILASWFETPGLVSLEAAMAGCAVVSTNRGSAEEYFGTLAHYCSPDSLDSIREAVSAAWERGAPRYLQEHVRRNFTWGNVALQTLRCYELALARGQRSLSVPGVLLAAQLGETFFQSHASPIR